MTRKGRDLSQGTLNPLHMMGLPNRTLEPISRSWSFCANDIEQDPAQDLVQGDNPFGIALMRRSLRDRAYATILRIALS
ncbi:hypothetical protein [Mesorhizobium sp. RIZ17]|uniref:hypothetical protein n=1 Tax=Mesorhizobium sp. RIZ17 TaxID=3132743 RepID=UPI003DA98181